MSLDIRLRDVVFLLIIFALALGWYFHCSFEASQHNFAVRLRSYDAERIEVLTKQLDDLIADGDAAPQPSLAAMQMLQALRGNLQKSL